MIVHVTKLAVLLRKMKRFLKATQTASSLLPRLLIAPSTSHLLLGTTGASFGPLLTIQIVPCSYHAMISTAGATRVIMESILSKPLVMFYWSSNNMWLMVLHSAMSQLCNFSRNSFKVVELNFLLNAKSRRKPYWRGMKYRTTLQKRR